MVFSTPIFLFLFLPITFLFVFVSPKALKNLVLLALSLLFYTWGEGKYIILLLFSILINYLLGILLDKKNNNASNRKLLLIIGVVFNVCVLCFFKYFGFFLNNLSLFIPFLTRYSGFYQQIHLPLGISFFTFQSLSYLIDIYNKHTEAQKNIINYALLIALFPHQIAGPIIRYKDIASQLVDRTITTDKLGYGIERFIWGLSKKMLLANALAYPADQIFSVPMDQLSTPLCWLGIICYTLQLYYDFSGYSDMAIGLGAMFGFHFLENFNFPYISLNIQEFWRRWHISLSSWFRDYVYIPLGGSRSGKVRTYLNLIIVFLLTGFWHGASWTFVIWGGFHGSFIILERLFLNNWLVKAGKIISHLYTILIVMVGWVLFRANDLTYACVYIKEMFVFHNSKAGQSNFAMLFYGNTELIIVILISIVLGTPISVFIRRKISGILVENSFFRYVGNVGYELLILCLLLLAILYMTSNTYNPFIYFRF